MNILHPSRRGSALAGAIVVIFTLLTVVLALHHYQGLARQTYMAAEADLRFREGSNFALQKQLFPTSTVPGLSVSAGVTNTTPSNVTTVGNLVAANIFDRAQGLPDLRALENGPAHTYLKLTPQTSDVGLRVFGNRTYSAVLTQVPGFAVFAPKGSVKVDSLRGWSNPTFDDPRQTLEAFSGVPAVVAAAKDATIGTATYADAYAINGTAKVTSGQGVAYQVKEFPVRSYTDGLLANIQTAKTQLSAAAASGDKTNSLVSDSVGPEAILDLFFSSGGLENFLSLRNANHFWLPMIPSFSPAPPYLYMFAFHCPQPPDTATNYDSPTFKAAQADLDQATETFKQKSEAFKQAEQALQAAKANGSQSEIDAAQLVYNDKLSEMNSARDVVEQKGQVMTSLVDTGRSGGSQKVPLTRADDPSGNDGLYGWSYSVAWDLLGKLFSFIPDLLSDGFRGIASGGPFNDDVKLIHFGSEKREFNFKLDESNMVLDGTLTVPRGRSLKLRSSGTITIRGDLWLQRGSTFVAECSKLELQDPPGGDANSFFTPCGRVFLEEGASLVCTGDLEVPGNANSGSVIVGGVPGKIHPITTAILCDKSVKLTNGVYAACAIDDLVEGVAGNNAGLKSLNDSLLRPLLSTVAPNAAKALGPFWARKPYFARYATTMQIVCPPTPLFGAPGPPIPTPIPLNTKNIMVPIARALAYVYSTNLNMSLGENFYTHSDWWIFGEGVVPMVPQLNPVTAAQAIANFPATALDSLNPGTIITGLVESAVKTVVQYVVATVAKEVVKAVIKVIPYGGLIDVFAGGLMDGIINDLTGRENANKTAGDSLVGGLTSTVKQSGLNTLDSLKTKFTTTVQDQYLREYNGVLVNGDTIEVGGNSATGMFIARHDLNVKSESCVGTLISTEGNVNCQSLLYYPYFNRASLYIPKATATQWLERAVQFEYDSAFASGQAVDVGPPVIPQRVSAQGWSR